MPIGHHNLISNRNTFKLLGHCNCSKFRTMWRAQINSNYFCITVNWPIKAQVRKNSRFKDPLVVLYPPQNWLTPKRFCNKQTVRHEMMFYYVLSICLQLSSDILWPLVNLLTYAVTFFSPLGVEIFVYAKQLARSDVICLDASNTCQTEVWGYFWNGNLRFSCLDCIASVY